MNYSLDKLVKIMNTDDFVSVREHFPEELWELLIKKGVTIWTRRINLMQQNTPNINILKTGIMASMGN